MNSTFTFLFALITLLSISQVQSFLPQIKASMKMRSVSRYLSDETPEADFVPPSVGSDPDAKLFDMNRRVRLGRSRDQDGKSNIWSVEPTMQVEEEETGLNKNLVVGVAVIAAALVSLPLFSSFSTLFPDPADF